MARSDSRISRTGIVPTAARKDPESFRGMTKRPDRFGSTVQKVTTLFVWNNEGFHPEL